MDSEQREKGIWFGGNNGRCSNYLSAVVIDGNNEHGHEQDGNSFSSSVVSPVKEALHLRDLKEKIDRFSSTIVAEK